MTAYLEKYQIFLCRIPAPGGGGAGAVLRIDRRRWRQDQIMGRSMKRECA
jgi:hypothetical protein